MVEIQILEGVMNLNFKEECRIFDIEEELQKIKDSLNANEIKKININICEKVEMDTSYFQLIISLCNSGYDYSIEGEISIKELKELYGVEL